jgi:hypothetical protein
MTFPFFTVRRHFVDIDVSASPLPTIQANVSVSHMNKLQPVLAADTQLKNLGKTTCHSSMKQVLFERLVL